MALLFALVHSFVFVRMVYYFFLGEVNAKGMICKLTMEQVWPSTDYDWI